MKKQVLIIVIFCFVSLGLNISNVFGQSNTNAAYYVKANGNDSNNGTNELTPLRTLSKAIDLASTGNVKRIVIIGTLNTRSEGSQSGSPGFVFSIDNSGNGLITITGKTGVGESERAILSGLDSGKGVIIISNNSNIRFENIEISGGQTQGGGGIAIGKSSGGSHSPTVTLGSGTKVIRNNAIFGGGILVGGGNLILDGGEINNNSATGNNDNSIGGGVLISNGSTFVITSGSIMHNYAQGFGGGVYVLTSDFRNQGGVISDNDTENTRSLSVQLQGLGELAETSPQLAEALSTRLRETMERAGKDIFITGNK